MASGPTASSIPATATSASTRRWSRLHPQAAALARLRSGITLEDGSAQLLSARHAPPPREVARSRTERGEWLRVRIGEGRKREVRRLFEAVGSEVERLVRVRIGTLTLAGLREGEWRRLRRSEVAALSGSRPR